MFTLIAIIIFLILLKIYYRIDDIIDDTENFIYERPYYGSNIDLHLIRFSTQQEYMQRND